MKRASAIKEVTERQRTVINRTDIELNQVIGRGASGVVYRAMFRGTEVAVKQILTENVSKDAVEAFELESAVMAYVFKYFISPIASLSFFFVTQF